MMNPDVLNAILSSPVLIAIVGVVSVVLTNKAKTPLSDHEEEKKLKKQNMNDKIDDIHSISQTLDRHINNSKEPFRRQINQKLDQVQNMIDTLSASVDAITQMCRSTNMSVDSLAVRLSNVEEEIDAIEKFAKSEHRNAEILNGIHNQK